MELFRVCACGSRGTTACAQQTGQDSQRHFNVLALLFDKANYAFNLNALPNLFTGLTILALGVMTLIRERGSRVAVPFFLLSLTMSLWMLGFSGMYLSQRI